MDDGWQAAFGSFIGYSIIGFILFFVFFPFSLGIGFILSNIISPSVADIFIKSYFIYYFPVFYVSILVMNGYFYGKTFSEPEKFEMTREEILEVMDGDDIHKKEYVLKKLGSSNLNPVFLRDTLVTTIQETNEPHLREIAFNSLKTLKKRYGTSFEHQKQRLQGEIFSFVDISGNKKDEFNVSSHITITNNTNDKITGKVYLDDVFIAEKNFSPYSDGNFDHDTSMSLQVPLEWNCTLIDNKGILHVTNISKLPINDVQIQFEGCKVEISGNYALKKNIVSFDKIDPASSETIYFNVISENPKMQLVFFSKQETTRLSIKSEIEYHNIAIESKVEHLQTRKLFGNLAIDNPYSIPIVLKSVSLHYFSSQNSHRSILDLDQDELTEKFGSATILPFNQMIVPFEFSVSIEEIPTVNANVDFEFKYPSSETFQFKTSWIKIDGK